MLEAFEAVNLAGGQFLGKTLLIYKLEVNWHCPNWGYNYLILQFPYQSNLFLDFNMSWKITVFLQKGWPFCWHRMWTLLVEGVIFQRLHFTRVRGGHFPSREVAILLAEKWSLLAEGMFFKDIILLAER